MALDDADNPLAIEIQQEKAEAYFAACRKMVDALDALQVFDRALASPTRDNEQITRRSELLEDAAERVYFVVIQREAMNLWCPDQFFEDYGIPGDVRTRLGPRRRKS
jgi:hypothetical protein